MIIIKLSATKLNTQYICNNFYILFLFRLVHGPFSSSFLSSCNNSPNLSNFCLWFSISPCFFPSRVFSQYMVIAGLLAESLAVYFDGWNQQTNNYARWRDIRENNVEYYCFKFLPIGLLECTISGIRQLLERIFDCRV